MTTPDEAWLAAESGADAVGLVFYPPSKRAISVGQARHIVEALPPFVDAVALFLDAERAYVREVLREVPVDLLQFHGTESAEYCASFGRRYIKSIGMLGQYSPRAVVARYPEAAGFLLDSHAIGEAGGTGQAFEWSRATGVTDKPVVLAGGLRSRTVAEAIRQTRPWAVDCSSGVESAPGVKDGSLMAAFIQEVNRVADD